MRTKSDVEVAVIGAGPYGLAVAAHLRGRNVPFRILGKPMSSWIEHMPKGMYLKSEAFASNIGDPGGVHSLARYCSETDAEYEDYGAPVSLETFVGYGLWFQQSVVAEVEQAQVVSVSRAADGFDLWLDDGDQFSAARVVVATGHAAFCYTPAELEALPDDLLTHSGDHRDLSHLRGKDVVVLGAGQSALETAALLVESGADARLVVRKPTVAWNSIPEASDRSLLARIRTPVAGLGPGWAIWAYSNLPLAFHRFPEERRLRTVATTFGPSGAWWLRERVEGRVPALVGRTLVGAAEDHGRAQLTLDVDGRSETIETDHVIAATGYRAALSRLPFLSAGLVQDIRCVSDTPKLSTHFESSVPGLYFVGLLSANAFGPLMRFVHGTSFAANRVAGHIGRRAHHAAHSHPGPQPVPVGARSGSRS
jgi:thioredoxin reductase